MDIFFAIVFCVGQCSHENVNFTRISRTLEDCENASLDYGFQHMSDGFEVDGPVKGSKWLMHGHEINPRITYLVCKKLRLEDTDNTVPPQWLLMNVPTGGSASQNEAQSAKEAK